MHSLLGYLNSRLVEYILKISSPTLNVNAGQIKALPCIPKGLSQENSAQLAQQAIALSKTDWDNFETSWDFQTHPLLRGGFGRIAQAFEAWQETAAAAFEQLKALEEQNNRYWIAAYGLEAELSPNVPDGQITIRRADLGRDVRSLLSYGVGCIMGRYSLGRPGLLLAGGPFDANQYSGSGFMPDSAGVVPITDTDYFSNDLTQRLVEFVRVAYGPDHLEENLDYIAQALAANGSNTGTGTTSIIDARQVIRDYLMDDFSKDHHRIYKKRPIYWRFYSGKQRAFGALVYLHRITPATLAHIRSEYVLPLLSKLQQAQNTERERAKAAGKAGKTASKRATELAKQHSELLAYELKLQNLADRRITLDLDDGVAYNYTLFKGLVYESTSDLKLDDLKAHSQWKRDLLAAAKKA
jgi:hypothetical protein